MHVRRLLIALATAGFATVAAAQTTDSSADIAFWNSVKDSKSTAEIQAYLDKFPTGTFADLARLRLAALKTAPAAPAPAAPVAAPTPPPAKTVTPPAAAPVPPKAALGVSTPEVVREIQMKLYNLNYSVPVRDGRMTPETRNAITQWRINTKRTETGDLTEAEVASLRAATLPRVWGVIGYNTQGGASAHWNVATREQAEFLAMDGCRKLNGGNCQTVTSANTACGALAFSSGVVGTTRYNGAYVAVRPTLGQATDAALTDCRTKAKVANNCGIRSTMCADGSHKK